MFRSIFRMREVIYGILWSKKCKIPEQWRNELRYAVKHCPSQFDITIKGKSVKDIGYEPLDIEAFARWVASLDAVEAPKKKRRKK